MKIAYFDCSSGISGDMCLGAIVDAGVSIKYLEKELNKIPVRGYKLSVKNVKRTHFKATKVDVVQGSKTKVKDIKRWEDIERIIQRSSLSDDIKQKGHKIFKKIFEAEAKVHGEAYDKLHLHELGAVDCVIDVFGTIIGLSMLGIDKVYSSPVNLGSGFIKSEAGVLPVPAPATAEILKNVPVYSKGVSFELTTPTGAAIIKELSSNFGDIPVMDIEMIGIGAGDRDFKCSPNILRLFVGNKKHFNSDLDSERVMVIEANIDDMNPQIYEYVMEKLFKAGALDVYFTQVVMKKGRPGVKMTVLCSKELMENMIEIILKETSTIGLRFFENKRRILQREVKKINTEFGKVRVKFSRFGDDILKMTPEYEDCKRIAKKFNVPLIDIMKKIK